MIERRWIEQLDSSDVQSRKIAVQQLARTRDPEAIHYLEATVRGDSDESVRDLARKAIVFIERHAAEAAASEDLPIIVPPGKPLIEPPPPDMSPKDRFAASSIISEFQRPSSDGTPAPPPPPEPVLNRVAVSPQNQKNAQNAMKMASKAAFDEEFGKAARFLVEAFRFNPNLQHDNYAVGIATTVSGLHKADAIKALFDGSILSLFDEAELGLKPARKKKRTPAEGAADDATETAPAGWGAAFVDILIYGLIHALLVGTLSIIVMQFVAAAIQSDAAIQAKMAEDPTSVSAVLNQLMGTAILMLVLYAVLYGLFAMISYLVYSALVHLAAVTMLGGVGTLPDQIHRTSVYIGIMTAIITVVQIMGSIFVPNLSPDLTMTAPLFTAMIVLLLSGYYLFGYASRIGQAYDISTGRGCTALVISTILMIVLSSLLLLLLSQIAGVPISVITTGVTVVP